MARNTKLYGLDTVEEYIRKCETICDMDILDGCLIDTYILYHDSGVIEVFEETYLNEWSSAYVRHIYRKGLPKRFIEALEEQERERDYYENLQNGTFDLMGAMI
jgi:hypothetical protein